MSRLQPLGSDSVRIVDGFWGRRLEANRAASLPHALGELTRAGNLAYLESAARRDQASPPVPEVLDQHVYKIFDSDVYKWLEAVAWELGTAPDEDLLAAADRIIDTVCRAATADGYLGTWVQLHPEVRRWQSWRDGHELYNAGHLIQAAVAWSRSLGDRRLLDVATAMSDLMVNDLGDTDILPAHPGVESALVELYRMTGTRAYLDLAERFVDLRGRGLLPATLLGTEYFVDDRPVLESTEARGHVVMALYLLHAVADLAAENQRLGYLAAAEAQWADMTGKKMYLTGGLGARHHEEAFGAAYELPADRAYAETCAAVASVMLSWRLLLVTGAAKYADLIERTLYNAALAAVSLDGRAFSYTNTLHRRAGGPPPADSGSRGTERQPWFECACCPPNLMRLLSSLEQYIATVSADGVQLHQLLSCDVRTRLDSGLIQLQIRTELPAGDGSVTVTVEHCDTPTEWTLAIRIPSWTQHWSAEIRTATGVTDSATQPADDAQFDGYFRRTRTWATGDVVLVHLDVTPRWIAPDPRIDAVRGSVALTRGPIVYCVEDVDLPDDVVLDDLVVTTDVPVASLSQAAADHPYADALTIIGYDRGGAGRRLGTPVQQSGPLYRPLRGLRSEAGETAIEVTAVPYHYWGNRGRGSMRVWLPQD